MHILIASPYLPWPLTEGGRVAQYRTFEAMRNACSFTLVVPVSSPEEETNANSFTERFPNVTLEAVRCFHVDLSRRASLRSIARKFLRDIFPAPKPAPSQASSGANPFYPFYCLNPDYVAAVEKHIANGCDIFQAEFADMLTLGPLLAGRVPSMFVHHQLQFVYCQRFMQANGISHANARYLTERMVREEAVYLNTFDSAIVFSQADRQALAAFSPHLDIHVSPFPSPEEPLPSPVPFVLACKRFVFVASESLRPNADGLSWFMKEVWPAVKYDLPDASIEVIGKWSLEAQSRVSNHEEIRFVGFVPELGKALQNKIMIVPVWIASGIRTKILAAWGASCPVVTTTVGMEGLPGQADEHFVIADDVQAFAAACIELSQNIRKLNRMAANGLDLVQQHYSLEAVREKRLETYETFLATH
jgi:glycosyltransferase involved in cell wall biosynthesis